MGLRIQFARSYHRVIAAIPATVVPEGVNCEAARHCSHAVEKLKPPASRSWKDHNRYVLLDEQTSGLGKQK